VARGYAGVRSSTVLSPAEVDVESAAFVQTGTAELDRVLGGGLVAGSAVLLGGDPGIGKSTLLLQATVAVTAHGAERVLYVSGEESPGQIVGRAKRLGIPADGLRLLAETQVERVLDHVQNETPRVLVIDSIQTMHTELLQSAPGGVAQVRESAAQLVRWVKQAGATLVLVGHVTKEGALAGPRVLEHMVDTVLYFESETSSRFRIIRAVKNRFGAAHELGLFAMTDKGLKQVNNPSAIFLSKPKHDVPGSVITVTREGSRPLLLEVQALVDDSQLGNPRRLTVGLDPNRLSMLLAVLHRHGQISAHQQDVYLNVVGGVRVGETAADLAVVAAVASSVRNQTPLQRSLVFGEVGLAGEIRPVSFGEERLREAAKHGFERAIIPAANEPRSPVAGLQTVPVDGLGEALQAVLPR
jgi:DNA repair protein RadA/Sms